MTSSSALRRQTPERQDLLERLARIQRSITHGAVREDVLDAICLGARELLGDEVAGLQLVPPDDPMARRISGSEERLRHEYNLEAFRAVLASIADIGRETRVTDGRTLFEYTRPR